MQPETPRQPLFEQPWLVDLLASKGFVKSTPTTFVRGEASIRLEGSTLHAHPGNGGKGWTTDIADADPETLKPLLQQILGMRSFLTQGDFARERIERQGLERALTGIANTIKGAPDTGGGVQLRRFMWSLYNGHHMVNLWRMSSVLDSTRAEWVTEVCAGAFDGTLREDDIKRALLVAGEMQRWDEVRRSDEQTQRMEEAVGKVEELLRAMPPSHTHTELKRAYDALFEAKEALRRAKEPESQ